MNPTSHVDPVRAARSGAGARSNSNSNSDPGINTSGDSGSDVAAGTAPIARPGATSGADGDRDLVIERIITAPRAAVWAAWTDPDLFAQWWIPRPYHCRVEAWTPVAGGGFVTSMSEDGHVFTPHMDAAFLVVTERERLVFSNALDSTLRPAAPRPVAVTGDVTLADHPEGTLYRIVARHADATARAEHDALGLEVGWTLVTDQLAALVTGHLAPRD